MARSNFRGIEYPKSFVQNAECEIMSFISQKNGFVIHTRRLKHFASISGRALDEIIRLKLRFAGIGDISRVTPLPRANLAGVGVTQEKSQNLMVGMGFERGDHLGEFL